MTTNTPPLSPTSILKDTFGYTSFLPLQREVIENVLAGRDSLAVMPTGGGKSLCYQIPALLLGGLTVVVSPLIALMQDQVAQLRAAGVPSLFLNSSLSPEAYAANMEYVRRGQTRLLYVSPETLLTPRIYDLLDAVQVDLITIDEAHCISEWGHDFRPEYRQLVEVRKRYPKAVCLALTATATARVRADIKRTLGFAQSNEFVASFNRPNLYIEVAPKEDALRQTLRLLERYHDQSGIIYCFSRKQVDELAATLARKGYSVRPYHAGLDDATRRNNQEAFIRDDAQIMVATIAFGMGINKPNVRFVVHYDLPKSIEGYYQEIGRAGRDGLPAYCLLLYSYGDVAKQRFFLKEKEGEERRAARLHLEAIIRYAEDSATCRRKPLLAYFGENYTEETCQNCDTCTSPPPVLEDITIPAQKFLSCVWRTGERYGAAHVIDVLRGSQAEAVLKSGHETLSTYGIGQELSVKQWHHLARQLIQMGLLQQQEEYRTLQLTDQAKAALRKRSPIFGRLQEAQAIPNNPKARQTELEYNHALFALLRQRRKELADAGGVPPYVIFSDKALVEMAAYYPQSREGLLHINGVGQVKLEQFGEAFLEVIRPYCEKHSLTENLPMRSSSRNSAKNARDAEKVEKREAGRRYVQVSEAYQAGANLTELARQWNVSQSTIVEHLARYCMAGNTLRKGNDITGLLTATSQQQQAVMDAFAELGTSLLKPVFDRLQGQCSYDDLKLLRLLYLTGGL